jgi:hypothetical protein
MGLNLHTQMGTFKLPKYTQMGWKSHTEGGELSFCIQKLIKKRKKNI